MLILAEFDFFAKEIDDHSVLLLDTCIQIMFELTFVITSLFVRLRRNQKG